MRNNVFGYTVSAGVREFTVQWPVIVDAVGQAFRMDDAEREWLAAKPIARLIGALPFIAGCDLPQRTAVAHLGTYILSGRETKSYFNADVEDDGDILARLRLIMNFSGGDPDVIDSGMARLALNMIEDYRRDVQIDAALGKYNPVASGAFDYETIREDLQQRIANSDGAPFQEVMGQDASPFSFWYK